jgi:uncharacterized surface protein with fasciclin (FAS1) repeats
MRTAAAAALLCTLARGEEVTEVCFKSYRNQQIRPNGKPTCLGGVTGQFTAKVGTCYPTRRSSGIDEKIYLANATGFESCTPDSGFGKCGKCIFKSPYGFTPYDTCRFHFYASAEPTASKAYPGACGDQPPAPQCKDIVTLAQGVKDLSTLVTAVVAGGLVDTLKGPGPFTLFAPTNEAFAALPKGTLEKLLKPENKAQLDDILLYHVLPTEVLSKDLKDGETAKTVEGKSVRVHIYPTGAVKVNNATVEQVDVLACNGVVHVIDGVLLPPSA